MDGANHRGHEMNDEDLLLTPVSESDPCGPDIRWEPEMLRLSNSFANAQRGSEGAVVGAETVAVQIASFDDLRDDALSLSRNTKDVGVLAVYAESSWRHRGLAGFAQAMEAAVKVMEKWPDPNRGVHPRADEDDGDLGERSAALGRLLRQIPELAATVGWGAESDAVGREETAATLTGIFEPWTARLDACFGGELVPPKEAWRALQGLLAGVGSRSRDGEAGDGEAGDGEAGDGEAGDGEATEAGARESAPADVWDLVDLTIARMGEQNRHSPALSVLRLVSEWRDLELTEITERMKASGVSIEQLMDAIRKQIGNK